MTSCGYQRELPPRQIGIFNRSHYEECWWCGASRAPRARTAARRGQGVGVCSGGTGRSTTGRLSRPERIVVVKLFLHLSYEEQCRRFLRRIDNPAELEFSVSDIEERRPGMPTRSLFRDALRDEHALAPWHVLPADHKWFTAWRQRARWQTHSSHRPRYPDVEGPSRRRCGGAHRARGGVVEATALTGPHPHGRAARREKAVFLSQAGRGLARVLPCPQSRQPGRAQGAKMTRLPNAPISSGDLDLAAFAAKRSSSPSTRCPASWP